MKSLKVLSLIGVLALGLFAVGCGGAKESAKAATPEKAEQTIINVVGSTSVTPVLQKLSDDYMGKVENVKINVQGVGSSAGVKSANDEICEIGMSSRNLKSAEKEWGLTEHVIAYDGIDIVVHPENPVADLTSDQVNKIFKGEITNWKEVGGNDQEILVVSREAGSGTRGAFEELLKLQEKNADGKKVSIVVENALIAEGNGAVKANIASKKSAIGYISLSYVDESVKDILVDGNKGSVENIKNGSYKVSRPFLLLTKGELSDDVSKFLDYIVSEEGQTIVGEKLITIK
jgi:phosphate transport system substrate-binding protein